MHGLLGGGVHESQFGRVQRQPWRAASIRHRRLARLAIVHFLAAHRVARLGKMNPNLVRTPRFQSASDERVSGQSFHYFDMRDRFFTLAWNAAAPAPSIASITHQVRTDCTGFRVASHDREITSCNGMPMKLL